MLARLTRVLPETRVAGHCYLLRTNRWELPTRRALRFEALLLSVHAEAHSNLA
jgi:hypothetical protein